MRGAIGLVAIALVLSACEGQDTAREFGAAPQVAVAPGAAPPPSPTLEAVRERGRVTCGVAEELPGFSEREVLGWRGFDIDICRAVAAAVFGDAGRVRIVPMTTQERYEALQAGQIDVIPHGGWNYSRDVGQRVDFAGVSYYDQQGVMVGQGLSRRTVDDLAGLTVCVQQGPAQANLVEHYESAAEDLKPDILMFDTAAQAFAAYRDRQCRALSGDIAILSSQRTLLGDPEAHVILPQAISKEPQGPVVRQEDGQWADIVGWTLNAMILAEEFGVTARSVPEDRERPRLPEIGRLLRGDEDYGRMLLLSEDWAYQVIRQVGNYGEMFDRNLGPGTAINLERGQNALWNAETPGLLYAPPMR